MTVAPLGDGGDGERSNPAGRGSRNRSDGALVRFITPMLPGETPDAAQQRILPFTSAVVPLLDDYIPR